MLDERRDDEGNLGRLLSFYLTSASLTFGIIPSFSGSDSGARGRVNSQCLLRDVAMVCNLPSHSRITASLFHVCLKLPLTMFRSIRIFCTHSEHCTIFRQDARGKS